MPVMGEKAVLLVLIQTESMGQFTWFGEKVGNLPCLLNSTNIVLLLLSTWHSCLLNPQTVSYIFKFLRGTISMSKCKAPRNKQSSSPINTSHLSF